MIHHVMEALDVGDGVTNLALRTADLLRELGEQGTILAHLDHTAPSLLSEVLPGHEVLARPDGGLLFHYWNYNTSTWIVHAVHGRKAIYYHNITPPHFFTAGSSLHRMTVEGYAQIRRLADCFDLVVASSRYNLMEFCGFLHRPLPALHLHPVIDPDSIRRAPVDSAVLARLRGSGETNLVFVGRVARNKRQDLLIRMFDHYHRLNPLSRLYLVGNEGSDTEFRAELERLRAALPFGSYVTVTGKVTDAALHAYLRAADVFVCASEHEGFCLPIAEAMALDVPVVARAAAAVPETLGEGGLLIDAWDDVRVAYVVDRLLTDRALRARVVAHQRTALTRFSADEARARLAAVVEYLRSGTWSPFFTWSHELDRAATNCPNAWG